MRIILFLMAALSVLSQQTTTSTTLTTAVPLSGTTQWCVASATGIVVPNTSTGVNGSYLLVDREVAQVQAAGVSATCFRVVRGQLGTSASASHSAASTVWVGQPATSSGDPSRPFNGAFITSLPTGSCVATAQYALPVLYVGSVSNGAQPGTGFNCVDGQWRSVGPLSVVNFTGSSAGFTVWAFGSASPVFRGARAKGTPQAPTAVFTDDVLGLFGGSGYDSAAFTATRGYLGVFASQNWTTTANGTYLVLAATPAGTTTPTYQWYVTESALLPFGDKTEDVGSPSLQVKKVYLGNCTNAASPAVCADNTAGAVAVAAAATTLVVNTTAVTAKSRIVLTMDSSLGTDLSVTCNTANIAMWVSARTAATSFTITTASGPVTNPLCLSYQIFN